MAKKVAPKIDSVRTKDHDWQYRSSERSLGFLSQEAQRVTLSNFYGNVDPRRKPEIADSYMLNEDHRAMANLPEKEINTLWNPGKFQPQFWLQK